MIISKCTRYRMAVVCSEGTGNVGGGEVLPSITRNR